MTALLAVGLVATVIAPHGIAQTVLPPTTGIVLWVVVLTLRAVMAISLAAIALLYLPATELFGLLTHWCLHAVVPFLTTHLGFDGHGLGDVAVLVPALVIALFTVTATFALSRAAFAARRLLRRGTLGAGPRGSLIVGGSEVMVAAAGLRSPRVVVSAGALVHLDDAELAAGLEHEWGHVRRRHGLVSAWAQLSAAVSRFLPGGGCALGMLRFHLERDADEYAIARTGDRLALASAIAKAANAHEAKPTPAITLLGGGVVRERLHVLLTEAPAGRLKPTVLARLLTFGALSLSALLLVLLPALLASPSAVHAMGAAHGCPA